MARSARSGRTRFGVALAVAVVLVGVFPEPALAHHPRLLTDPDRDAELVVDAASGKVLFARNDGVARHPASLTKMMTLYLLFENLAANKLSLQSELPVSAKAASQPRSHMRLRSGSALPAEMAIKGIIVCSANDAAVAVAEAIGGTEQNFAVLMNAKARELGMIHTFYHNASGLPDDQQVTTAGDLAILAKHLIYDFPQYYGYFGTRSLTWRGEDFNTHNMLISSYPGADGLKTGYIDTSGYNLVVSAVRDKARLIAVVMGGVTRERRDEKAVDLLDDAFAREKAAAAASLPLKSVSGFAQQKPQVSVKSVTN